MFSFVNVLYYSLRNSYNIDSTILLSAGWFIWVSCSVLGRVITLAIALGYFITVRSISKHYFKIVMLMLLMSGGLAAELIVQHY